MVIKIRKSGIALHVPCRSSCWEMEFVSNNFTLIDIFIGLGTPRNFSSRYDSDFKLGPNSSTCTGDGPLNFALTCLIICVKKHIHFSLVSVFMSDIWIV